jgi:serine/threonine protein phosphatase PrpC
MANPTASLTVDSTPSVTLTPTAYGITDKGRVRPSNEDQFLVAELSKAMRIRQTSLVEPKLHVGEESGHVYLVADGMGGHRAGERASALTVTAIEQFMLNSFKWFFAPDESGVQKALAEFQAAITEADARVMAVAAEHPELSGMGTTVTLAFHLGSQVCLVHVGDSRGYLYRDGQLHQVTHDHTLVADLLRSGAIQPEEAAKHRYRHVITNVVGGQQAGVSVEAHAFEVKAGDRLLLCSDGLTEMLTNETIAQVLEAMTDPQAAATQLVAHANDAGGRDNITVLIVRFDEAGDSPTATL